MALFIVATPIGTISDLSSRAIKVLGSVDLIASEDTRMTRKLLNAVEVSAPELIALHAHNEEQVAEKVATRSLVEDVALVTDAGTPGVSDPGRRLMQVAHELGAEVRSVPGPSALSSALALSGLPASPSTFLGFAPRKGRDKWLHRYLCRGETLVVFEAPTRVADLISRVAALTPSREVVLCREISKHYEEVLRSSAVDLASELKGRKVKGECVVVIAPGEAPPAKERETRAKRSELREMAAVLAERCAVTNRDAYQALIAIEEQLKK